MDPATIILVVAWAITRSVFNYKVDREYARQGMSSPRYDLKMAKLAAAGRPASEADSTPWGAKGYFKTLVRDAFEDATERHNRIRAQKKAAKEAGTYERPTLRERAAGFGHWLWEGNRQPSDVVPPQPTRRDGGGPAGGVDPFAPPPPQATDGPRYACPVCGESLEHRGGTWQHPPESTCESASKPSAAARPTSKPAGAARGTARVPQANRREPPQTAADPLLDTARQPMATADPHGAGGVEARDRAAPTASAQDAQRADGHGGECEHCGEPSDARTCQRCTEQIRARREKARELDAQERGPAPPNACPDCGTPVLFGTHCKKHAGNAESGVAPDQGRTDQQRIRNELYGKCAHRTVREGFADEWCDNPYDGNGPYCRDHSRNNIDQTGTSSTHTSNGGNTVDSDLLTYNQAVAEHEAALQHLRHQHANATAFKFYLDGSAGSVEAMDAARDNVAKALAPLAEGMEGSRFGTDATQGAVEAASSMTAGSIGAVQEHLEAATNANDKWIAELGAAIESVQASLQHLKATFGEAAATVQETGVDARALAAD